LLIYKANKIGKVMRKLSDDARTINQDLSRNLASGEVRSQAVQALQESAFTTAGWASDKYHLAGADVEVHPA
jgi:hypothetical protein